VVEELCSALSAELRLLHEVFFFLQGAVASLVHPPIFFFILPPSLFFVQYPRMSPMFIALTETNNLEGIPSPNTYTPARSLFFLEFNSFLFFKNSHLFMMGLPTIFFSFHPKVFLQAVGSLVIVFTFFFFPFFFKHGSCETPFKLPVARRLKECEQRLPYQTLLSLWSFPFFSNRVSLCTPSRVF